MQDVQNIPNPDVDSFEREDDFGSHSDAPPVSRGGRNEDSDVERPAEDIPTPPDEPRQSPVEEPPSETDRAPIGEDNPNPPQLV